MKNVNKLAGKIGDKFDSDEIALEVAARSCVTVECHKKMGSASFLSVHELGFWGVTQVALGKMPLSVEETLI